MWFIRLWRAISSRAAMSGWRVLSSSIAVFYRRIHLDFRGLRNGSRPGPYPAHHAARPYPGREAQQWIDAVMPQEELAARSDFEIVNDGEQDIDAQVRKLLDIINNKE